MDYEKVSYIVHENFDELMFTNSNLHSFFIEGSDISFSVTDVDVFDGYPVKGRSNLSGVIIFSNVLTSIRSVTGYIGEPTSKNGFKPAYELVDLKTEPKAGVLYKEYGLEGVDRDLNAWIDWVIIAEAMQFRIDN